MRICILTDSFSTGGGLTHIWHLCNALPDYDFLIMASGGKDFTQFLEMPNVKIETHFSRKTILDFKPSIVHVHHLKALLLLFRRKIPDLPIIFTVHGVHSRRFSFIKFGKLYPTLYARFFLEKFLYRLTKKIIAVSNEDASHLVDRYKINPQKIEVIENGIDWDQIKEQLLRKEIARDQLSIPLEQKVFLMLARFDFPKGHMILLEAIRYAIKNKMFTGKEIFLFAGDGPLMERAISFTQKNKLENHVIFLGKRSDPITLICGSDFVVMPSLWEGLPLVLLEALACGKKIIASDTFGFKDAIQQYPDRIVSFPVLDSIALAHKLCSATESSVFIKSDSHGSVASMAGKIRKVYESVGKN